MGDRTKATPRSLPIASRPPEAPAAASKALSAPLERQAVLGAPLGPIPALPPDSGEADRGRRAGGGRLGRVGAPGAIKGRDLAIVVGIMVDKLGALEDRASGALPAASVAELDKKIVLPLSALSVFALNRETTEKTERKS